MKRTFSIGAALLICSAAAMAQYTNLLENGTEQTVTNAWSTTTVWVGNTTSNNTLYVIAGGDIDSADVFVGASNNAFFNTISMTGTSRWDIAGQLVIGERPANSVSVTDGSTLSATGLTLYSGNELTVEDGGSIEGLVSMSVYSNSTISGDGTIGFGTNAATLAFFGTNITLDAGVVFSAKAGFVNTLSFNEGKLDVSEFDPGQYQNFGNLVLVNSDLTGTGSLNTFAGIDMTGGWIDPAGDNTGTLEIGGVFTADGTTYYRAQVDTASNDLLDFSGAVDLQDLNLFLEVSGTTTGSVAILSADGGVNNGFNTAEIISRPLLYTATLQTNSNDISVILEVDDDVSLSSMLDYAATESIRAGFSGMKNMVFTRTKQLRRNLVSTAHAIPNEVMLLTPTNAPAGAMGPGDQNTIFDMHVWIQQYSGQGDYDRMGVSDSFALNNNGTTIGVDKLIGEALILGFNYTYARSAARANNSGDLLDTETYWIGAYGEWIGAEGMYVDALASYGITSYDSERFADGYHGTASYDGYAMGLSADVGQYYYYGENLALSPYAGLHVLTLMAEAHDETEDAGSRIKVDETDHSWIESALGLKLRHRFDTLIGRFQTTGYAEWTYDFLQDEVYSSMSSAGLASVDTAHISPDESGINAGLGYSWICTDYMEIGVGYNGRFSDNFEEHTGSLMLDIMF